MKRLFQYIPTNILFEFLQFKFVFTILELVSSYLSQNIHIYKLEILIN
jgi:hypothetical protein